MTGKDLFRLWFSNRKGKIRNLSARDPDGNVTADINSGTGGITRVTLAAITAGNQQFLILPESAMKIAKHPHLFGFCQDGEVLFGRYFWMSGSEGCWRCGTGYRHAWDFKKGLENVEKYKGGYTFETQLHFDLERALTKTYETADPAKLNLADKIYPGARELIQDAFTGEPKLMDRAINYLHESRSAVYPFDQEALIYSDYSKEISYVEVLDEAVHNAVPKDVKGQDVLRKGAVSLQQEAGKSGSWIKDFKKNNQVWDIITACLKSRDNTRPTYRYDSALLGSPVKVESYTLKAKEDVVVEIAYTEKAFHMNFTTKRGIQCKIDSPFCWVKSVYIPTPRISTFGNYSRFPLDLCFLPQKPMDYYLSPEEESAHGRNSQVSHEMKNRQADMVNHTYVYLALLDEKYSPLIQEFKKLKQFPLFKWSSPKFQKTIITTSFLPYAQKDSALFLAMRRNIIASCYDYLLYHFGHSAESKNAGHGSVGMNRVIAFREAIYQTKSFDKLNNIVYSLFANNKVGETSFSGFLGIGNAIRTKPNSYIVYFYNAMYESGKKWILEGMGIEPEKLPEVYLTDKALKGKSRCLARFVLHTNNERLLPNQTQSKSLEGLLDAIRNNN